MRTTLHPSSTLDPWKGSGAAHDASCQLTLARARDCYLVSRARRDARDKRQLSSAEALACLNKGNATHGAGSVATAKPPVIAPRPQSQRQSIVCYVLIASSRSVPNDSPPRPLAPR